MSRPGPKPSPWIERFVTKVKWPIDASDCWEWTGALSGGGYGSLQIGGRNGRHLMAHRLAYESIVGPIPSGLQIDHLCRNRACVNPAHLEPVTQRENLLRGDTLPAKNAKKTHCVNGHSLADAFVERRGPSRKRSCRTCNRLKLRRRYEKRRP